MPDPLVEVVRSHVQDGLDAARNALEAATEPQDGEDALDASLAVLRQDLSILEARVMAHVATMPARQVPATLYEIEGWFRTMQRIRQTIEAKADSVWDEAVPFGGAWKGPDGEAYVFDAAHSRKVSDPEGMREALLSAWDERHKNTEPGSARAFEERRLIMAAFPHKIDVKLTPVNQLAEIDPRYKDVRDEFCSWSSGPKHLKPLDGGRRT